LAALEGRQLHLTHEQRFGLVDVDFVALALPGTRLGNVAFSLLRVGVADIPFTTLQDPSQPIGSDNRPVILSKESSADYALYLSSGRRLHRRLEVGAASSALQQCEQRLFGLTRVRLRLQAWPWPPTCATATTIFWSTDTTDHPAPRCSWVWPGPSAGRGRATAVLASGGRRGRIGAAPLEAGLDYGFKNIALRAGLEEERRAFGLGLQPHQRLTLDLAYLEHDGLDPTYRVSAGFRF
jgi:hypothetical protein